MQKYLIENGRLYVEQANHYDIIGSVQDFPELTDTIESRATQPGPRFERDYDALTNIDVIRAQEIRGRNFTFSRGFLTGEKSSEKWLKILDTADNARVALKSLMDLQGNYGGFISHQEIVKATGWNSRAVNNLIRHVDNLGIAQRTHTIEMKDALSRATSGTLLNMNYREYNNAESILGLTRDVPITVDILNVLRKDKQVSEDVLLDQFELASVQQVRNSLKAIGLIKENSEESWIWELVPYRDNEKFISEVLTVAAHSRRVLPPDYDPTGALEDEFKKVDEDKISKETAQMKLDFFKVYDEEEIKK